MSANVNELPADAHAALLPTRSHTRALPLWPKNLGNSHKNNNKHWGRRNRNSGHKQYALAPPLSACRSLQLSHRTTSKRLAYTHTHMRKKGPRFWKTPQTPATRAIPRLAPKKLLISLRSKRQTKPKFCTHEMYTDNGSPFIMQNPNSKLSFDPLK